MTWAAVPWVLAGVGCLAAIVMYLFVKKKSAQVKTLADKLASITLNLARLKEAKIDDQEAQVKQRRIDVLITEAKSEDDAKAIRNMFVNRVTDGLRDLPG